MDLESCARVSQRDRSVCARPGRHRANASFNFLGKFVPNYFAILMTNYCRIGGERGILLAKLRNASMEKIEGFQQSCRREKREPIVKAPGSLLQADSSRHLDQYIA